MKYQISLHNMPDLSHKDSEKPMNGYFSTESHIFTQTELRPFNFIPAIEKFRSSGDSSRLYSGGAQFESRPGHRLYLFKFFVGFLSPSRKIPELYLELSHGLPSVGIMKSYGLDDPGSILGSSRLFSSPQRPYRFWGPPSLLSTGHWGFPLGVKLTAQLQLAPRPRMVELYLHSLPRLHGVVENFNFTL
jgi:hypothetical protein